MDEQPTVTRLGPAGRTPGVAVALLATLVAVAIVKPWGGGPPLPTTPRPSPPVATPASPSRPPATAAIGVAATSLREHCLDPGGWRVFSHEQLASGTIRSWKSVEPATSATGPLDATLPVVLVAAPRVTALGYCAPLRAPERPPEAARVTVWTLVRGRTVVLAPRLVAPAHPTPLGGLWAPDARLPKGGDAAAPSGVPTVPPALGAGTPPAASPSRGSGGGPTGWSEGRFVFAVRAAGWERWWAVDVLTTERRGVERAERSGSPGQE